jgi:hypothetical protein
MSYADEMRELSLQQYAVKTVEDALLIPGMKDILDQRKLS